MKKFKGLLFLIGCIVFTAVSVGAAGLQLDLALRGGYSMISNDDFNQMIDSTVETNTSLAEFFEWDSIDITGDEIKSLLIPGMELSLRISNIMAGFTFGIPITAVSVLKVDLDEPPDSYFCETEYQISALPIGFNLSYILETREEVHLFFGLGLEYITSTITFGDISELIDGVEQELAPLKEYKGSGIIGLVNFKCVYSINSVFSLFLGATGRLGKISGYEGQGDEEGKMLYSAEYDSGGTLWHDWTPSLKESKEGASNITSIEEAAINMNGVEVHFGIMLNFGLGKN